MRRRLEKPLLREKPCRAGSLCKLTFGLSFVDCLLLPTCNADLTFRSRRQSHWSSLYIRHSTSLIMGDIVVESAPNPATTQRQPLPSSIPNFEALESVSSDGGDEYSMLKKLQRELEYGHGLVSFISHPCWLTDDGVGTSISKRNTSKMNSGTYDATFFQCSFVVLIVRPKESKARARTGTRRDQADTECAARDRTVYGSHRSEVGRDLLTRRACR